MAKIKFTSKRGGKPSKLQRACGEQRSSQIFYKGESIMSVTGNSSLCLLIHNWGVRNPDSL